MSLSEPNATRQGPASWREVMEAVPALPVILIAVAAHMMLFGMLTPVMASYAQGFGVSDWQIGLMITLFALGRLGADIPAGHFAQRFGLFGLLWTGPLLCAAGSLLGAIATDYTAVLIGRTVQGVGSGLFMTAATIFCAQQSDQRSRGKIMSIFQGAMLVGATFGPSVGGISAVLFGQTGPFWVAMAVGAVTTLVVLARFPAARMAEEHAARVKVASGLERNASWRLLLILPFACVLVVNFGVFMTRTAGQWQMIPLMVVERFAFGPEQIGLALTLAAFATLLILPVTAWLVDRVPRPELIFFSLLGVTASLAMIILAAQPWMFYLAMLGMGVATGISGPAVAAYAVDVVPEAQQAPAMGIMRFAGDLGYLVGPVSLGFVMQHYALGYTGGIAINAALLGLCALAFIALSRRRCSI